MVACSEVEVEVVKKKKDSIWYKGLEVSKWKHQGWFPDFCSELQKRQNFNEMS